MKFVIVEDEIWIREGIRRLLPKLDEENRIVGEAENGLEGLNVIREEKPDIIIADIRMPVMDGLEMLEILYNEGCNAKAIFLSAYSEFEYARTAIRLGVREYLVKPIVMGDFSRAVDRVKCELEKEGRQKQGMIGTLNQMLRNILAGDLKLEPEVILYLKSNWGIEVQSSFSIFVTYFEKWDKPTVDREVRNLQMMMAERPELSYCLIENERQRELQLILYNHTENQGIKRWIQGHFLNKSANLDGLAMGWVQAENLYLMKESYEQLESYLEWNIPLGDEIIISCPEITKVQTVLCVYPIEIENQLKVEICANDYENIEKSIQKFHDYFQNKKMYEPKKIKECYIRFFWMVINLSKEIGSLDFEDFEQQELLKKIMHTKTMQGLKSVTAELLSRLQEQGQEIDNILIKRAIMMIHEFYQMGITLDEISGKLGITPEYLGTQFHQAMGVTFSTYTKNYRLNKAKELLLGTQLKLYEIADMVGYSDPKYFSKVFKSETGQLPAEYRKTKK